MTGRTSRLCWYQVSCLDRRRDVERRWAVAAPGLHRLQHLLGDVEVRPDVLHVVVLLERLDQPDQLLRGRLLGDLDRRLGDHRQLGGLDLEARVLDGLPDGRERLRRGRDLEDGAVALDDGPRRGEVLVVPGEGFGAPGYARLSYALGDDDIAEGLTRIGDLLSE